MTKAQDAAQWLWAEVQWEGSLSQPKAVDEIAKRFGTGLTQPNSKGGVSITPAVLHNFRLLHRGRARWYRALDNYWRLEGGTGRDGAS